MASSVLKALQSPSGLLDVLAYLAENDGASPTKAIADLGMKRPTFYACLVKLRALGFIFERRERGYPPRAHYGLTRTGLRAAEHIKGLAPLVEGSAGSLAKELEGLRGSHPTPKNLAQRREILLALIEQSYVEGNWDRTLQFANELRLMTPEAKDKASLARAELWIGKVLQKRNDEGCLAHLDAAFHQAMRVQDLTVAAEAAYVRGCHLERKGRYDDAEAEFRRCGDLGAKSRSNVNRGRAALGLGRTLVERGRVVEARESLDEARRRLEANDGIEELPAVYANLGASFFPEDARIALAWHERAIRACELGGFVRMLAFELLNAAGCLQRLGDSRAARQAMDRARDLAANLEDAKLLASVLIQSASLRSALRDLGDAERDARRAIEVASAEGLLRELANAHYLLGDILGKRSQRGAARQSLERALKLFRRVKDEGMARRLAAELRNLKT